MLQPILGFFIRKKVTKYLESYLPAHAHEKIILVGGGWRGLFFTFQ